MNVCFVSRRFYPAISGMSTYAFNLLEQYSKLGHDVTLVAQYRGRSDDNVYRDGPPQQLDGVKVVGCRQTGEERNGDFEYDIAQIVNTLTALNREQEYDILHAQFVYPPGLAAVQAARRLKKPSVVSIQGGDGHWFGLCCAYHMAVSRAVLADAGAVIVGSESFADEIRANTGADRPFRIIPGGVNTNRFRPPTAEERSAARAHIGLPVDGTVILYHGRLDRRKGIAELLDAFAMVVSRSSPSPMLVVSGVGPDADWFGSRVDEMGLGRFTTLLGYVPYTNSPGIYQAADVFCTPTYAEGFSNTVLEAMASGLAVVSTSVTGVVDAIDNERHGLLVPPRSAGALADALLRVLADGGLRVALGERARQHTIARFDWRNVAARLVEVYQEVFRMPLPNRWEVAGLERLPVGECRFRREPQLL